MRNCAGRFLNGVVVVAVVVVRDGEFWNEADDELKMLKNSLKLSKEDSSFLCTLKCRVLENEGFVHKT